MTEDEKRPIEEIVAEVGRYSIDAYAFIQECIAVASEHVHGPMSDDERVVAEWMVRNEADLDELRTLAAEDQLPPEVSEVLERIGGPEEMNRHVTGEELCWAIRDTALKRWGLMARGVLNRWQIKRTEDIGEIVFALVNNDWLQKQPDDSVDDFKDVFSFAEAFDQDYKITGSS